MSLWSLIRKTERGSIDEALPSTSTSAAHVHPALHAPREKVILDVRKGQQPANQPSVPSTSKDAGEERQASSVDVSDANTQGCGSIVGSAFYGPVHQSFGEKPQPSESADLQQSSSIWGEVSFGYDQNGNFKFRATGIVGAAAVGGATAVGLVATYELLSKCANPCQVIWTIAGACAMYNYATVTRIGNGSLIIDIVVSGKSNITHFLVDYKSGKLLQVLQQKLEENSNQFSLQTLELESIDVLEASDADVDLIRQEVAENLSTINHFPVNEMVLSSNPVLSQPWEVIRTQKDHRPENLDIPAILKKCLLLVYAHCLTILTIPY